MSRLSDLQNTFQQAVLSPDSAAPVSWISNGGRAPALRQFQVYRHAYSARLTEALANDYPALRKAIGDEAFHALCQEYLNAIPSRSYSLRHFGQRFDAFVRQHPDSIKSPWMEELVRFEWHLGLAFDAYDTEVTGINQMAQIDPTNWPDLRFVAHPSVQRLDFCWNVTGMWSALTKDTPKPVHPAHGPAVGWLIWRENLTTQFRSLPDDEQTALDVCLNGENFASICESLTTYIPSDDVPLRAATLLKGWLNQGLITDIL